MEARNKRDEARKLLAEDTKDEPLNPLTNLTSNGIEAYEAKDDEWMEFLIKAGRLRL